MPATHLSEILDLDDLKHAVAEGLVAVKAHPTADAFLLGYTAKAQYTGTWSNATKQARGLIVAGHPFDEGSLVVARPVPKFANAAEHGPDSPFGEIPAHLAFEVHEKVDGSLAILYDLGDGPAIATRGSFESDQAVAATRWLREHHGDLVVPDGTTPLFEFIAPWNRIVVDYGDVEELVFLSAIDHATGADVAFEPWGGRRARTFSGFASLDEIAAHTAGPQAADAEGFVVRFIPEDPASPSLRAKLKYAEYLRLHKLVTGVSTVTIWEHLKEGMALTSSTTSSLRRPTTSPPGTTRCWLRPGPWRPPSGTCLARRQLPSSRPKTRCHRVWSSGRSTTRTSRPGRGSCSSPSGCSPSRRRPTKSTEPHPLTAHTLSVALFLYHRLHGRDHVRVH